MYARNPATGKFEKVKQEVKRIRLRKEIVVNIDDSLKKVLLVEH